MNKLSKQLNQKSNKSFRPAYHFDDTLRALTEDVRKIIEKEEREQNQTELSYGANKK